MKWSDIASGLIKLNPADIVLVRSPGVFGKLIRWASRHKGEAVSRVNHVLLVEKYTGDLMGRHEYNIIDTMWTVYRRSLYCYANPQFEVLIARDKTLNVKEALTITSKARSYIGSFYSPMRIGLHLIDKMLGKVLGKEVVLFSQFGFGGFVICNQVAAMSYSAAQRHFGRPAQSADPDHMYDWILAHPEKYEIVFMSDGITMDVDTVVNGRLTVDFA